jgi:8-oxo-dGTP diphosphatase
MHIVIEVVAGVIQDDAGRYLITQRPRGSHLGGLWEFPGGKIEAGELPEAALRRELTEELGASFQVGEEVDTVTWEYPDRTVVLRFYRCVHESGTISPRESQIMRWVTPDRLDEFEFPPADRQILARLTGRGSAAR